MCCETTDESLALDDSHCPPQRCRRRMIVTDHTVRGYRAHIMATCNAELQSLGPGERIDLPLPTRARSRIHLEPATSPSRTTHLLCHSRGLKHPVTFRHPAPEALAGPTASKPRIDARWRAVAAALPQCPRPLLPGVYQRHQTEMAHGPRSHASGGSLSQAGRRG